MTRSKIAGTLIASALLIGGSTSIASAQPDEAERSQHDTVTSEAAVSELSPRTTASTATAPPAAAPAPQAAALPVIPVQPLRPDEVADEVDETIDEEALARALERSLVLSGGVLLPPGQYEIEPGLQYDYYRSSGLAIVPEGIAHRDITQESFAASLGVRMALPWASQLNLSIPYVYRELEDITAGVDASADDSSVGDIQLGISRQVFGEGSTRPAVIADLAYQWAADGAESSPFGIGYDAWSVSLTVLKRTDPLVLVGSLTHAFNRSTRSGGVNIDPDDSSSGDIRAILAASPGVSLRAGFSLSRTGDTQVNGEDIAGTRQTTAMLEFGGSIVVSPRVLFDLSIGAGLTEDAPDFVLGVSLPIRSVVPWVVAQRPAAG